MNISGVYEIYSELYETLAELENEVDNLSVFIGSILHYKILNAKMIGIVLGNSTLKYQGALPRETVEFAIECFYENGLQDLEGRREFERKVKEKILEFIVQKEIKNELKFQISAIERLEHLDTPSALFIIYLTVEIYREFRKK